jgi:6-pyruvoyltetrahydropterin/6-carboxytetrahydropterin synthase
MSRSSYRLRVQSEFSAAHQLNNYQGACERLHGHNFKVQAEIEGRCLDPKTGMLLDFKVLKSRLSEVLAGLDHRHLNELEALAGLSPSSENLAYYIFQALKPLIVEQGLHLRLVSVAENETSTACYLEERCA